MQSPPPINGSTSTHTASETCLLGGAAAHHLIVAWRPIPQLKALTELFAAGRGARAHRDAVGDAASEGLRAAFIHPGDRREGLAPASSRACSSPAHSASLPRRLLGHAAAGAPTGSAAAGLRQPYDMLGEHHDQHTL
eukprot:gene13715-biopygen12118